MQVWQWKDSGLEKSFAQNYERASDVQQESMHVEGVFNAEQYVEFCKARDVAKNVKSLTDFARQVSEHAIDLDKFTNGAPFRLKVFNRMTGFNVKLTTKAMQEVAKNWNS